MVLEKTRHLAPCRGSNPGPAANIYIYATPAPINKNASRYAHEGRCHVERRLSCVAHTVADTQAARSRRYWTKCYSARIFYPATCIKAPKSCRFEKDDYRKTVLVALAKDGNSRLTCQQNACEIEQGPTCQLTKSSNRFYFNKPHI
jgi:hypothetical protein